MRKRYSPELKTQIVLQALREEKTLAQLATEHEVHPNQISAWKAAALQGLPAVFTRESKTHADKAAHEQQREELYAQIGKLTTQVAWLKKTLVSTHSRPERLAMVERGSGELTLQEQAELLSMSRSSLYYTPRLPCAEEVAVKHRIDVIYTKRPYFGSRRVLHTLQAEGVVIGRNTVRAYMQEMGLEALYPKPNTSQAAPEHRIYPYLLRHVKSERSNHVWGIDIAYIRCKGSWMYLVAILDWYSRYIVNWELDQTLEIVFVLACLDKALGRAIPAICNSDQGSHFTSPHFVQRLLDKQVAVSMDGRGRALDNIFTERLWRTVKYEEVYLNEYATPRETRQGLTQYLTYYNDERPHQSLGYQTPAQVYFDTERIPHDKGDEPNVKIVRSVS